MQMPDRQLAGFPCLLELLRNALLLFPVVDFPTPKTELVQKFLVQYLGMLPVDRPVGRYNFPRLPKLPRAVGSPRRVRGHWITPHLALTPAAVVT